MKSLLLLGEDVCVGKFLALAKRPGISLLVALVEMVKSTKNDCGRVCVKWTENVGVGKGVGKACEVETRAKNAKGRCLLIFIVEDSFGKERTELHDVLVGDVVRELRRV